MLRLMQPMLPGVEEGKLHAMVSELRCALKEADLRAQQSAAQVVFKFCSSFVVGLWAVSHPVRCGRAFGRQEELSPAE